MKGPTLASLSGSDRAAALIETTRACCCVKTLESQPWIPISGSREQDCRHSWESGHVANVLTRRSFKLKRISVTHLPFILSTAVHLSVHCIHFKNGPPSHALFPPPAALPRVVQYWIFHLRLGPSQILALLFLILCFSRNGHQLPQPVSADFFFFFSFLQSPSAGNTAPRQWMRENVTSWN